LPGICSKTVQVLGDTEVMASAADRSVPSEVAVVDTFTRLIFGAEEELSAEDMQVIRALRIIDDNIALDDHAEMGIYLRALGVKEMIRLVSLVRRCFPLPEQTRTRDAAGLRATP
jgi:hypothetical protein